MKKFAMILLACILSAALLASCAPSAEPTPPSASGGAPDSAPTELESPPGTPDAQPAETSPATTGAAEPSAPPPAEGVALLTPGVLTVGSEIGYPPFEFFADDGVTPIGLDIDLAKEIARELGVEVRFENTAWDGIFAGLDVDKYDCVMSAVTINAGRLLEMDFTQSYIENWQSITVKKGSAPVTSAEGLDGLRVGFQGETTSDEYLTNLIDSGALTCVLNPYDKVIGAFDDLRLGRLDAVIADSTVADGYITREPDNFELTWHQSVDPDAEAEVFGVAIKKGNAQLADALNSALQRLEASGKLEDIRQEGLS
jgi:polar amino acid transport system substrate-binding protein